ncbi:hypothetical protein EZS27_027162 [termite gut metagenome]|uniref:Phospholipase/carboxylesterase/thioesterase domain-containing protein n=1 Tax=termite gut metagenome TaxID=433724 RepID=A0A5J4QQ28_9ZZZZ
MYKTSFLFPNKLRIIAGWLLIAFFIPIVLCTGCSGDDDDPPDPTGTTKNRVLQYKGHEREYLIYTPSIHPHGIIIAMHGIGQKMTDFTERFDFRPTVNHLNYLLISPQALPEKDQSVINSINVLRAQSPDISNVIPLSALWDCGLRATISLSSLGTVLDVVLNKNIDDAGFLDTLIKQTLTEYSMENRNIFVSGTSMGGYMSYQYALTHGSDIRLSGIIPIVGTHGTDIAGEGNEVKVPVCDFSSETDEEVPYYNGWYEVSVNNIGTAKVQVAKPKPDVIDFWVAKNGAVAAPIVYTYPTSGTKHTTVTKYTYAATNGKNEVIHYQSDNTDHNYFFKKSNEDAMDYLEEITKFIQAHEEQ